MTVKGGARKGGARKGIFAVLSASRRKSQLMIELQGWVGYNSKERLDGETMDLKRDIVNEWEKIFEKFMKVL